MLSEYIIKCSNKKLFNELNDDNLSLFWKMFLWMFNKLCEVKNDICDIKMVGLSF